MKITDSQRIDILYQKNSSLQRQLHEIRNHLGMSDITDEPKLKQLDQSSFKELTGSDLCRAMLARGDSLVMCKVSDIDDAQAKKTGFATVVLVFDEYGFEDSQHEYKYAVPINNQGEPLTQADVGL